MSCPGGCLGGGGQPIPTNTEIRMKRAESIYEEDSHKFIRKSHENPEIKYLYDNFLKSRWEHYPTTCCIRSMWRERCK